MSMQILDFGTASDNDGETPYTAWPKVQANFEDLYSQLAALGLDSLTDVVISTPTNGQVLKYNGTNWVNGTDATGGGSAQFLSIVDYGAVGDGTTNNLAAIEAAITAADGRRWIIVPETEDGGDYAVTSGTLTIPNTAILVFEGAARIYASGSGTVSNKAQQWGFGGGNTGEMGAERYVLGTRSYVFGTTDSPSVSEVDYNIIAIREDAVDGTAGGGSKVSGLLVDHRFGGATAKGGRHALYGNLNQTDVTAAANTDTNYVGVVGQVVSAVGDNGTGGGSRGAYFAFNAYAALESGALYTANVTGGEFNSLVKTGASTDYRSGIQVVGGGDVRGSVTDAAVSISNLGSATTTWKAGVRIGAQNGVNGLGSDSYGFYVSGPATIDTLIKADGITCSTDVITAANMRLRNNSLIFSGSSPGIELGSTSGSNTPFIDFHSSGNNNDYDARLIATGGSGSVGTGDLKLAAASFSPSANDGAALGTSSLAWSDIFLATGGVINWASGGITLTEASDILLHAGAQSYKFDAAILPTSSDGAALGSTALMFSDLFLASGAVLNFNNGDVTVTHASNNLLFAGASSGYTFDAKIYPTTDDGAPLGDSTHHFSDLFLASGGVINWNNGDVTATHSADTLAFAGASSGYTFDALVTASAAGNPGRFVNTTNAAANQAIRIESDRASPAATDSVYASLYMSDDAGTQIETGRLTNIAATVTAGAMTTTLALSVMASGTLAQYVVLSPSSGFRPSTNDQIALGSATVSWADLFLASGAVINFNNGNYTVTHSAGLLSTNNPLRLFSATAVPAGGTAGLGLLMTSTSNLGVFVGSGAPSLSAAQGSLYIRTDGSSTSTRLYVNTNGSTTWTNVTTAA